MDLLQEYGLPDRPYHVRLVMDEVQIFVDNIQRKIKESPAGVSHHFLFKADEATGELPCSRLPVVVYLILEEQLPGAQLDFVVHADSKYPLRLVVTLDEQACNRIRFDRNEQMMTYKDQLISEQYDKVVALSRLLRKHLVPGDYKVPVLGKWVITPNRMCVNSTGIPHELAHGIPIEDSVHLVALGEVVLEELCRRTSMVSPEMFTVSYVMRDSDTNEMKIEHSPAVFGEGTELAIPWLDDED